MEEVVVFCFVLFVFFLFSVLALLLVFVCVFVDLFILLLVLRMSWDFRPFEVSSFRFKLFSEGPELIWGFQNMVELLVVSCPANSLYGFA